MRFACLLSLLLASCGGSPHTVFFAHQHPSPLYIDTAHGGAQVKSNRVYPSDIIKLVLHPTDAESRGPVYAMVLVQGTARGVLKMRQKSPPDGPTEITGSIVGLSPGEHGFHIHQTGNLTEGCISTGAHFNPFQCDHGAPWAPIRHAGDLGNIVADQSGTAYVDVVDKQVTLVGPNSAIGRAIVVHEKRDDLGLGGDKESITTGNAGKRLGCGVIGRA